MTFMTYLYFDISEKTPNVTTKVIFEFFFFFCFFTGNGRYFVFSVQHLHFITIAMSINKTNFLIFFSSKYFILNSFPELEERDLEVTCLGFILISVFGKLVVSMCVRACERERKRENQRQGQKKLAALNVCE